MSDPDSNENYANINVTVGGGPFGLETTDGSIFMLVVTGRLDRETTPVYDLRVAASDAGDPPLNATRRLVLPVADVNDNAPQFRQEEYSADVLESVAVGTSVLQVSFTYIGNHWIIYSML